MPHQCLCSVHSLTWTKAEALQSIGLLFGFEAGLRAGFSSRKYQIGRTPTNAIQSVSESTCQCQNDREEAVLQSLLHGWVEDTYGDVPRNCVRVPHLQGGTLLIKNT